MVDGPWGPQQVGIQNNVAELDLDIIIADAPDTINNSVEGYQALTQAISAAAQGGLPPQLVAIMIKAHPSLPTRLKKELLDALEALNQPNPQAEAQAQAQQERAAAEMEQLRATTFKTIAEGERAARQSEPQFPAPVGEPIGPIAAWYGGEGLTVVRQGSISHVGIRSSGRCGRERGCARNAGNSAG